MISFWEQIKSLFKTVEESSPSNPAVHEIIERSPEEQADYLAWKHSLDCRRLTDWLGNQYAMYQVLPNDLDEAIDFLDTPSSKGFVIHFHKTDYSRRDVTHFFDYLKERVQAQNYKPQISDTRTYIKKDWVETVERHYLKPRASTPAGQKSNQRFGNVTIELQFRNDAVHNLKFQATSYNDHLFTEAEEFKELMQVILE